MLANFSWPSKVFVTGTDTNVGKTVVSAILTLGLKAKYWKPIQSGADPITDTDWIKEITHLPESYFLSEVYRTRAPLSPHLSAELEGINIDIDTINLPNDVKCKHLIVEGAGGIMVPLNKQYFMLDLIRKFHIPVLIVARSTLGTINHTLLTIERLRESQIPILGVILNGPKNADNRKSIEHFGKVRVIMELEPLLKLNSESLLNAFIRS